MCWDLWQMRRCELIILILSSSLLNDFILWQIFCNGRSKYAGQPAGVVVAETRAAALKAAALVVINYKQTSKPIISTRNAPEQSKKVVIMKDDLGDNIPKCAITKHKNNGGK